MTSLRLEGVTGWTGRRLPGGRIAETDAVLVRGGRILAMGGAARAADADKVVDASGQFLAPAFGDGHIHPLVGGLGHAFAPIRGVTSIDEVVSATKGWADEHPEAAWVRGDGLDITLAPGGVFRAEWLDAVLPDRPVFLHGSDGHTVWVNSEALRRAGYVKGMTQPSEGEVVLDSDGSPVGTLRELSAFVPVMDLMPQPTPDQVMQALDRTTTDFAAAGITWIQDALQSPEAMPLWASAARAGAVHVDADLAFWLDPKDWRGKLDGFVEGRRVIEEAGLAGLTARTVKFFADGIIESTTGALLSPDRDCPNTSGIPTWDPAELTEAMTAVDALGFTAHVHAIGDAAVRETLDAMEHVARTNPPRDRRWTMAHLQLVDPADFPRFAELGVVANFEPYWAQLDRWQRELNTEHLGAERLNRQYQIGTVIRSGAEVSFGSDWPVTTFAPLECMQVAVTRQADRDSAPWMPEERITVDEALAAYTRGIAFQAGRSDAGELRPGARADLVLLAQDPRVVDPMSIGEIEVLGTWRAGERIFG